MQINILEKTNVQTRHVIEEFIKTAKLCGIKIYLVGGIVRDILLSKELKDVDITVEGSVKDFVEALLKYSDISSVKYSETLPTAKVIFSNGEEVDIASTREEIYKNFGDLPIVTKVGCKLEDDVKRRDFTVNAIALSLNQDNLFEIIDYLGGVEDLLNKKLRLLHEKSFYDDPSRIIRAAKFIHRLDFSLDVKTLELQKEYLKNPLRNIPLFRVKAELYEFFALDNPKVFDYFVTNNLYRIFVDYFDCALTGERLISIADEYSLAEKDRPTLYFLPVFINENVPEKLNLTIEELKIIKDTKTLFSELNTINFSDKYSIYSFFRGKEDISVILYAAMKNKEITDIYFAIKDIKPITTGKDLKKLGIPQGKIYSEIIEAVQKEKINNGLKNFDFEINFVRKYLKKKGISV